MLQVTRVQHSRSKGDNYSELSSHGHCFRTTRHRPCMSNACSHIPCWRSSVIRLSLTTWRKHDTATAPNTAFCSYRVQSPLQRLLQPPSMLCHSTSPITTSQSPAHPSLIPNNPLAPLPHYGRPSVALQHSGGPPEPPTAFHRPSHSIFMALFANPVHGRCNRIEVS